MRAARPVPVADRSSRPGATTTAFLVTSPTPRHDSAICTIETPAIFAFSGCTHGSCSSAAARIASPASHKSRASRGSIAKTERVRVGDRVPHAAKRNIHGEQAKPVHFELRAEPVREARHVRQLDALDPAVATARRHLDQTSRRLKPQRRLESLHLLEHRRARRRLDARDDDVRHFAARVATVIERRGRIARDDSGAGFRRRRREAVRLLFEASTGPRPGFT
jgi:hypothetical protein